MFLSTKKCEGIGECIKECPTGAIRIINGKAFSCITCGACEEACPKDAVYLSETFAPANYQRKGFIYGKDDLLIPDPKAQGK